MREWRSTKYRHGLMAVASCVIAFGGICAVDPADAGAVSPADQGVTATTLKVGFPIIDFAALQAVGVKLNDGNFQDAYTALIANMNAHGGIDGRKVVPYFVLDNPAVTSSSTTACTQLTEDDHVFVSILPVYPDCYQVTHDTPVIAGQLPGTLPPSAAADFSLTPPDAAYDPVLLGAFKSRGVFKGKKVGIYYGTDGDDAEAKSVQTDLEKLHVNVALLAGENVPATDTVASDEATQTIALRFKGAGVNEVIAVGGSGATDWPRALLNTQSAYRPSWIATSVISLASDVAAAKGGNSYFDNVMTSSPVTTTYDEWQDPAIQKCYQIVHKAYPNDPIAPPPNPEGPNAAADGSNTTYSAVESSCQNLAILAKIADAAGKHLTVASFTKAGYGLRNVTFPGSGGPVSFGPDQPYATGHAFILQYSTKSGTLVPASPAQG